MKIFLMGMKHSGKTTVGRLVASELRLAFADLDELVQKRLPADSVNIREFVTLNGIDAFRAFEAACLRQFCAGAAGSAGGWLLAAGGGIAENPEAFEAVPPDSLKVFLDADMNVLLQRITAGGLPYFLQGGDPLELFRKVYEIRTEIYRRRADIIIDTRGSGVKQVVNEIISAVRNMKNGR